MFGKSKSVDKNEEVEPVVEEPKRRMFTDILKEAAANIDSMLPAESEDEVKHVGKIIMLMQGKRVFSEAKTLAPGVTVKLGNLTARHKDFIASMCISKDKVDDDGKPIYNDQLSLDITMALMWSEINGVLIEDPMGTDSKISNIGELLDEISDRSQTFNGWPASWLERFVEIAKDFTQELIDTCSEENVKAF